MNILIAMDGFLPGKKYGGPPVSIDNFCSLMKEDSCFIITKNHDFKDVVPYSGIEEGKWMHRENCTVKYLSDSNYNKEQFQSAIEECHPDIIYLQSLFQHCILSFLILSKAYHCKVFLAPRGELCAGAFKKKYKKIPYIAALKLARLLKNVHCQSTSGEETTAIHAILGIPTERIHFLTNVPSMLKKEYSYPKKKKGIGRFVFLSRIHPKKNLIGAISYFAHVKGNAVFDIYGPLEDEAYWNKCQAAIALLPPNVTVKYCGIVTHDEVHMCFSQYDAFLFPTFSENFGHVIVEALMVGCPVIISDQTPWNDVNEAGAGWAIPLNKPSDFSNALQKVIDADSDRYRVNAKSFASKKLNLEALKKDYEAVFHRDTKLSERRGEA